MEIEDLANDNFMRILLEVCQKTTHNAMIQHSRMVELWRRHFEPFNVAYHAIRLYKIEKNDFVTSLSARIETLEQCEQILVDTYWAIKMVAIALFQTIPPLLSAIEPVFDPDLDIELFKLKISEKFVNSLMAFFSIEKDILTPDLFVYGKINTTLRVKKMMTNQEISNMILKDGVSITPYVVHGVMTRFQELGLIQIDAEKPEIYKFVKKLELSPDQEKVIQSRFFPFVEWGVETWRTMFNIRELNTPIPESYARREVLNNIVSYAATQGFTTAHFCFSEIKKYFLILKSGGI